MFVLFVVKICLSGVQPRSMLRVQGGRPTGWKLLLRVDVCCVYCGIFGNMNLYFVMSRVRRPQLVCSCFHVVVISVKRKSVECQ